MFFVKGKKRKSNTSYGVTPQKEPSSFAVVEDSFHFQQSVLPSGNYLKHQENEKGATWLMQITSKPQCKNIIK